MLHPEVLQLVVCLLSSIHRVLVFSPVDSATANWSLEPLEQGRALHLQAGAFPPPCLFCFVVLVFVVCALFLSTARGQFKNAINFPFKSMSMSKNFVQKKPWFP
jgi:hypothetical protein